MRFRPWPKERLGGGNLEAWPDSRAGNRARRFPLIARSPLLPKLRVARSIPVVRLGRGEAETRFARRASVSLSRSRFCCVPQRLASS
jgi:hypothetical protein